MAQYRDKNGLCGYPFKNGLKNYLDIGEHFVLAFFLPIGGENDNA